MTWHPSDRLFRTAGDQPPTGEPMAQDLPHACSYCGHTEFEEPVDTGRGATASCKNCGGSMSSWGGQWTPELVGDPSNHPSPKVDPRSGAGFGQNYLLNPDGMNMFPSKESAFSLFEVTAMPEQHGEIAEGAFSAFEMTAANDSVAFHFKHEETDTGGTKFPRRVDMTAHHPESGEEAGRARYYPPKRKGGPVSVEEVKGHAPGAASALLNEIESRHPDSSTKFLYEVKRNNNNPDMTGHSHERAGKPSDWDTHYPKLAPTIYRGLALPLPERSARVVNSSSAKEDHLAELHGALAGSSLGPHWTEDEHSARLFAHNAISDHRKQIPVVLHAKTPDRKDIETREQHLYRGGIFPYGDPHSKENEVPFRKGRNVEVTGMSWKPDALHPDADEHGWIHHTYSDDERRHHTAMTRITARPVPSGKPPVDWDTVGAVYPHIYGDPEVHGEAAEGSGGQSIGDAANHLAHDRPDDPDAESSSVHDLEFHPYKEVPTEHIDYVRHPPSDPRVAHAIEGYKTHPNAVPPLVLVHRHGVYHVADGHHRAAAAAYARVNPRALVAYSPHPDEPFSDGSKGPGNGAEPTGHHTAMPKIRRTRNEEIAEAAAIPGTTVYRGVRGDHAHAAAEATRQGVPGSGDHGPGIYVSSSPYEALQHAREHQNDDRGVVLRGRIHPDASVVHRETAPPDAWSGKAANDWARGQGHDVMTNGQVHVVLNPAAVEWEPKNYSVDEGFREFTNAYRHGAFSSFGLTAAERPLVAHDPEDHDVADEGVFIAADTVEASLQRFADGPEQEYRMQHQAPDSDYGAPLHDVESMMPDFYTHPHYYNHGQEGFHESASVIHGARGNPEKKVRIYRALPAEHAHKGFNPGDWVSTSPSYARLHAKNNADPKHDWPVIRATVPAKHLHTEGDVHEWAYNGPNKSAMVSFKGGYHQEVRHDKDGNIVRVKRRPKKDDPLKGFSIQHHESDANTDDHEHHVFAYDDHDNYAGQLHTKHGEEPYKVHVEPHHEGGPLEQRMREKIPHLKQGSRTSAVDWCAHRHMGGCFWPGDNPVVGKIPQRRGACNWTTPWQQQLCPMSDPGPMAGMFVKGARESSLLPVKHAGFTGFVEAYPGHHDTMKEMDERTGDADMHPAPGQFDQKDLAPVGAHPQVINFAVNHLDDADLWRDRGSVENVDLRHGVHATQPYLVREHLNRYVANPDDATDHVRQHGESERSRELPSTQMPLFVRHQGNLFSVEGHHRTGAALTRGDQHIKGLVYDADQHDWPTHEVGPYGVQHHDLRRYAMRRAVTCHIEHPDPQGHALFHHDDGICAGTELRGARGLDFQGALADPEVRFHFHATWADVRNKAKRIRREGGVRILMASSEGVVGEVRGDNNIYETTLTYVPGSARVGTWNCGCKWAAYAWGRSPKYRRFEGRMCSHALAIQFEAQARSAHGRTIMPDTGRPDWLKQRTPVVIQHQRDKSLDLTRRTVPPGNMRSVFGAVETPCHTPGSQYHTEIGDHQVSVTVDLPTNIDITQEQAETLDGDAHNAMELVLAPLFAHQVFSAWEMPIDDYGLGSGVTMVDGQQLQSTASDSDLHMTVQRALDQAHENEREKHQDDATYAETHEPLRKSDIPEEHHSGWRFHRNVEGAPPIANMFAELFGAQKEHQHMPPVPVTQYKHPMNREPLHLDEHGNSWRRNYEWTKPDAMVPEFKGWSGPHSAAETLREHPTWSTSHGPDGERRQHQRTHEERLQMTKTDPTESHEDVVRRRNRALTEQGWGVVSSLGPSDAVCMGSGVTRTGGHPQGIPIELLAAQLVEDGHDGVAVMRELLDLGMPHTAAQRLTRTALGLTATFTDEDGEEDIGRDEEGSCHFFPDHDHEHYDMHGEGQKACPYESAHTNWDSVYPKLGDLHRGMSVSLPHSVHEKVHDQSAHPQERAKALLSHLPSVGTHWSPDHTQATHYSYATGRKGETPVVVSIHKPHREHIETDPEVLDEDQVIGFGHHDDAEVPVQYGAPVHVKRVSWAHPDRPHDWTHIDVDHHHTASARLAASVCPECHGPVAPHATSCPHCGAQLTPSGVPDVHLAAKEKDLPGVAGVVLKALDTGRILMLQRGLDDEKDPARGTWEFPGGHVEDGDLTALHGAIREWEEEVGQQFPEGGVPVHTWVSPNGVYAGYVVLIPSEKDVSMSDGRVVPNPDDPKGDCHEQAAWWSIEHAKKNPALRPECKTGTPWKEIERAGEGMKAAALRQGDETELDWWPVEAGYSINSPLQELMSGLPIEPPPHSNSENPASTGFATSEDPDSWADPQPGRADLMVWSSKQEGYNAWRDRLWSDLMTKQAPVPQTGHLYRTMSDEEMQAGRQRGAFHPLEGEGLFVTDDPDRIGRKGGGYGGKGAGGHIIEIDPAKVKLGEKPSYYNRNVVEKTVDHVPMHAVTRTWTWNDEAGDHLPSDAHKTALLHDEPEPALPSTDGEREAPLPPGTPVPQREQDALQHGYDDLSEFREDHPELGGSSGSGSDLHRQASDASSLGTSGGVAAIVAAFQQTAGAQALATGPQKEDKMDISSAARQYLAGKTAAGPGTPKTALKDFTHAEQQQLIHEGADGVTARNLPDLQIAGTHYSALEAALQEKEKDGVDPTDIFVL